MTEAQRKIAAVREILTEQNLSGIVFRGLDWFYWATCGGEGGVLLSSETGVAEILITEKEAWVLTNQIENPRLAEEEVPKEFGVQIFAWEDREASMRFIKKTCGSKPVVSDRPKNQEAALPDEILALRLVLGPEEIARYRKVGRLAAEAMTVAMKAATPQMTEQELAAVGAKEIVSRGLDAALILVGNHRRSNAHRHPMPKKEPLGESAMMVFCARGHGLHANMTRFVYFRDPTAEEKHRFTALREIEATGFESLRSGRSIASVYQDLAKAYAKAGLAAEIHNHHQGGPCGYLSREAIANPQDFGRPAEKIRNGMAFAWNPSLPGAKVEDTILLTESGGIEILTHDPLWPTELYFGRQRPSVFLPESCLKGQKDL